jgi:DNA-binding NtrC family response regulator
VIVCQGDTITVEHLPPALRQRCEFSGAGEEKELELPELERQLISRTLDRVAGQRQQAAEILGISLDELNLKMRSYRLDGRE